MSEILTPWTVGSSLFFAGVHQAVLLRYADLSSPLDHGLAVIASLLTGAAIVAIVLADAHRRSNHPEMKPEW